MFLQFQDDIVWNSLDSEVVWRKKVNTVLNVLEKDELNSAIIKARSSSNGLYKDLLLSNGANYFVTNISHEFVCLILKARCNLLNLNDKPWRLDLQKTCSLCNLREIESVDHFFGRCPLLKHLRFKWLGSYRLENSDIVDWLNGKNWIILAKFLYEAWDYRKYLVSEYNY